MFLFFTENIRTVETLTFASGGLCLCLSFAYLPGTDVVLLVCAVEDAKIHLYADTASQSDGTSIQQFEKVMVLKGHEDWIRALDFTVDGNRIF